MKQAKLQWLQNQSKLNEDNLDNLRCQTSRHFRNEEKGMLKYKINELVSNSKNKNIMDLYREVNKFKRGCQHRKT
jgi:hypothetical protein